MLPAFQREPRKTQIISVAATNIQEAEHMRVLIVEDEAATRELMAAYLANNGFTVTQAGSGDAMQRAMAQDAFDIVLLDIRLPDGNGLELARDIVDRPDLGVIFVTSVDDDTDRVVGLELGADDYITKPVKLRELLARIRSTARRLTREQPTGPADAITLGAWSVDLVKREVTDDAGAVAPLTRAEFDLLAALVSIDGRPASRDFLLDVVSRNALDVTDRSVDTLISRLRRKLGDASRAPALIVTERGFGYRANINGRD